MSGNDRADLFSIAHHEQQRQQPTQPSQFTKSSFEQRLGPYYPDRCHPRAICPERSSTRSLQSHECIGFTSLLAETKSGSRATSAGRVSRRYPDLLTLTTYCQVASYTVGPTARHWQVRSSTWFHKPSYGTDISQQPQQQFLPAIPQVPPSHQPQPLQQPAAPSGHNVTSVSFFSCLSSTVRLI